MGSGSYADAEQNIVIGVLALQGAFVEHIHLFRKINVNAIEVRSVEQLQQVDALVLPGGESTAISLLARRWGLIEPLREWVKSGKPIWGTCAGMILLSDALTGKMQEGQETIGGLNATVYRNYFGSQAGSFHAELHSRLEEDAAEEAKYSAVFIRAPVIVQHGDNVKILATVKTEKASNEACERITHEHAIVAAQQDNILVTSFHPELTEDPKWHSFFNKHSLAVIQKLKQQQQS